MGNGGSTPLGTSGRLSRTFFGASHPGGEKARVERASSTISAPPWLKAAPNGIESLALLSSCGQRKHSGRMSYVHSTGSHGHVQNGVGDFSREFLVKDLATPLASREADVSESRQAFLWMLRLLSGHSPILPCSRPIPTALPVECLPVAFHIALTLLWVSTHTMPYQ